LSMFASHVKYDVVSQVEASILARKEAPIAPRFYENT
jgi:hypothetical protein